MKIEVKQTVYVVVERWLIDYYDCEVNVFSTRKDAEKFADKQAKLVAQNDIDGTIKYQGDTVIVDDETGEVSDWWEATIYEKEVK